MKTGDQVRHDPAIHDSDMDEIQWYRWHASPSEQLPSMDEMFAELPMDLRQVLASMTQKKPGDRPEDSKAALALLDSMSSSVRYSEAESIGEPEYAMDGVSVFGNPPTLHDARFETPTATWIEFLRNPVAKFSELNGQQRMIAASVGMLLMASALLLPLATASRQTDVLAKAEKPKEEMDSESPKKRIEKPGSSSKDTVPVSTKSDPTNNGSGESILSPPKNEPTAGDFKEDSLPKGRITSFEIDSGGEVLSIDQGGEPLVGSKKWKLQPGGYTAKCIDSQKVVFDHRFSVPEGDSELLISINRSFKAEETPKFVEDLPKQRESMLFRHDYQFPFVGVDSQNVALIEKAHRAIDILLLHVADARLKRLSKSDNLTARNDIDRDPRISYLLALHGYYLSRYDNAIELCRESIRVVEKHRIPFVLPYQLLAQVHIARRGEVSSVFAICLQSIATTNQWYQKEKSEKHLMLLSEQLWCAGNLLAHSDQVFGDGVARIVDIDYYAQRFEEVNATLTHDPLGVGREDYQFRTENIDELDVPIVAADAGQEKHTIEKISGDLSKLVAQVGPSLPQYQSRSRSDYSSSRAIMPAKPSKNPYTESKPNRWRVPDRPLPFDDGVLISRIKSTLLTSS